MSTKFQLVKKMIMSKKNDKFGMETYPLSERFVRSWENQACGFPAGDQLEKEHSKAVHVAAFRKLRRRVYPTRQRRHA